MERGKITVAGIGPGSKEDITPAVLEAVRGADVVVGYKYYFQFIEPYLKPGCQCIDTGMKRERERAEQAFAFAKQGKDVVFISSGDAGIYGMTPLIYEMARDEGASTCSVLGDSVVEIVSLPGISAFQKAASLLGCPMGHDFCVLSLSDLMTPWETIERRIRAAAVGDFVTAVYNPKSHGRYWQLYRLVEIFLQEGRSEDTPVGFVRQAGREDEAVTLTTLGQFDPEEVDMFTVVIIGNSQSYRWGDKFITPRGYYREATDEAAKPGQQIMMQSFRTILKEMKQPDVPRWRLWPMLHAIHTTVDFGMEECLWMDDRATETLYNKVKGGTLRHIVTDVTMAASGIRKGALDRLGIEVHCYINDPRSRQIAADRGITRSQACMRLAAEEYPEALYVVGNAPTALFEICDLVRSRKIRPAGLIAAPVGFVHVCESKHAAKTLRHIPKIIVEGRKGGSNLAATLCNAILTYDDAEQLRPGRDL
ncbi:MAG: precorrin-3B C(17)-methyltransferase [Bacteroidaceae bacterium]|nr:precorrin-3B C(17)-methyltransferase [Bacteroidaceae bacterium]